MNATDKPKTETWCRRALDETERRYEQLLGCVSDYVYTVSVRSGQAVSTLHGPGCKAVTGYSQEEFETDPFLWFTMVYPDDRGAVMDRVRKVLNGEFCEALEHRIIDKSGKVRWIRNTTVPRKDREGRLVTYDGLVSDITERKEAEFALRESQERLALVMRGNSEGIWDWNFQTGVVYYSDRWKEMLGYGPDEIEPSFAAWERLIHPEDQEAARARLNLYLNGQSESFELEHRLRHKDGSYRWILARGVALRDEHGKPTRMAGSHFDLTGRKMAEQQLERAYAELGRAHEELKTAQLHLVQAGKLEAVGTLVAGVAHEVKNPLQTIVMGLDYLAKAFTSPDSATLEVIDDMNEAIVRANTIVQELLRLSADRDIELKEEDLNPIVERALLLMHNEIVSRKVRVVTELAADLPKTRLDRARMEQVLLNLLLNALQAMPGQGDVTIRTFIDQYQIGKHPRRDADPVFEPQAPVVVVEVQDTGTGIAEKDLPRVFDPFFTTKPAGVGTGLGLPIVKNIVTMSGGAIGIKNGPEKGAIVTIVLKPENQKKYD